MNKILKAPSILFNSIVSKVLDVMMPIHAKRILFLVTLYKAVKSPELDDAVVLGELNQALHLAKTSTDALIMPSMVCPWIWQNDMKGILTCNRDQVRLMLRAAPYWLRYGRDSDIMHDVMMLRAFIINHEAYA